MCKVTQTYLSPRTVSAISALCPDSLNRCKPFMLFRTGQIAGGFGVYVVVGDVYIGHCVLLI